MEDFEKLDCGCYVGFDVNHRSMWGKQCPKHNAVDDLYEALKELKPTLLSILDNSTIAHPAMKGIANKALEALAKAEK